MLLLPDEANAEVLVPPEDDPIIARPVVIADLVDHVVPSYPTVVVKALLGFPP